MSQNLSRKPILAIISDTSMYIKDEMFVFEPVLREVRSFSNLFNKIIWLGFNRSMLPPLNAKLATGNNYIELLAVKPCGGKSYIKKIGVILLIPYYFLKIIRLVKKSDVIHTRGPSIPAMLTIFISFLYPNKKYWHKYAGNWQLESKAISYRFQKWLLLKLIPGKVIVSQKNKLDPPHILSWLNPCLTEKEITINKKLGIKKYYKDKFVLCFIGRLEEAKGFPALLDAISNLNQIHCIDKVHFVGEKTEPYILNNNKSPNDIEIIFHGTLDRLRLNQIYADSHFIILPSKSEGFPKVLAEASSFGCIPIIPPIPSIISQVNEKNKNGIILPDITSQGILNTIMGLHKIKNELSTFSVNAMENARKFSYEKYYEQILNNIL